MSYLIIRIAEDTGDKIPMKHNTLPTHVGTIKSSYPTYDEAHADMSKLAVLNPGVNFAIIEATK